MRRSIWLNYAISIAQALDGWFAYLLRHFDDLVTGEYQVLVGEEKKSNSEFPLAALK